MAKQQKVLLIGATGFTGKRVIDQIEEHNRTALEKNNPVIELTVLCRPGREAPTFSGGMAIPVVRGDLDDLTSLKEALRGKDGLMYVASLGFGHAPNIVQACEEEGVKRAVFVSTTAIFTQLNAPSKKVRMAAEATIIGSDLDWTILRPTMIYGRKGDRNMERLVKYLKRIPVLFSPGDGRCLQQPVFVDDVAAAVVLSYLSKKAVRKSYNVSGDTVLTFREVVNRVAKELGRKRLFIPVPLGLCRTLLRVYEKVSKNPRLKEEQVLRLNENKAFDHIQATEDFNYHPRSFKEGIGCLVEELRNESC